MVVLMVGTTDYDSDVSSECEMGYWMAVWMVESMVAEMVSWMDFEKVLTLVVSRVELWEQSKVGQTVACLDNSLVDQMVAHWDEQLVVVWERNWADWRADRLGLHWILKLAVNLANCWD